MTFSKTKKPRIKSFRNLLPNKTEFFLNNDSSNETHKEYIFSSFLNTKFKIVFDEITYDTKLMIIDNKSQKNISSLLIDENNFKSIEINILPFDPSENPKLTNGKVFKILTKAYYIINKYIKNNPQIKSYHISYNPNDYYDQNLIEYEQFFRKIFKNNFNVLNLEIISDVTNLFGIAQLNKIFFIKKEMFLENDNIITFNNLYENKEKIINKLIERNDIIKTYIKLVNTNNENDFKNEIYNNFNIINENKLIDEPIFTEAHDFNGNLATASEGNLWGYINKNGKYIIDPIFDYCWDVENNNGDIMFGGHVIEVDFDHKNPKKRIDRFLNLFNKYDNLSPEQYRKKYPLGDLEFKTIKNENETICSFMIDNGNQYEITFNEVNVNFINIEFERNINKLMNEKFIDINYKCIKAFEKNNLKDMLLFYNYITYIIRKFIFDNENNDRIMFKKTEIRKMNNIHEYFYNNLFSDEYKIKIGRNINNGDEYYYCTYHHKNQK